MSTCPATSVGGMGVCGLGGTQTKDGPLCKSDKDCDTEAGFACTTLSDGMDRCFQQTHCLPGCTMSAECPEAMTCDTNTGICVY